MPGRPYRGTLSDPSIQETTQDKSRHSECFSVRVDAPQSHLSSSRAGVEKRTSRNPESSASSFHLNPHPGPTTPAEVSVERDGGKGINTCPAPSVVGRTSRHSTLYSIRRHTDLVPTRRPRVVAQILPPPAARESSHSFSVSVFVHVSPLRGPLHSRTRRDPTCHPPPVSPPQPSTDSSSNDSSSSRTHKPSTKKGSI